MSFTTLLRTRLILLSIDQFGDEDFPLLSGARIIRIATSPDHTSMGYGRRALELLINFYEGQFSSLAEEEGAAEELSFERVTDAELANTSLLADDVKVRDQNNMPPLFSRLSERRPDRLDYVYVSFMPTRDMILTAQ